MELKDVILSTLAEMEERPAKLKESTFEVKETINLQAQKATPKEKLFVVEKNMDESVSDSELIYLKSIKERLLVLFEGFQAPNNKNIEAKIDMTLNFLEYTLATIDTRVEILEKRKR